MAGGASVTTLDLAHYDAAVADVMLPHVAGRPLTMQRFPDGLDAGGFHEKRQPAHFPDWFGRVQVQTATGRSSSQPRSPPPSWPTWRTRRASRRTRGSRATLACPLTLTS